MPKKYWEIKNAAEGVGEIFLYGDIVSAKWHDDEVTPKDIDNELKALGKMETLNIYINSGGGSVFSGMAIYNILKRADAKVKNAYVDGLAASISSVIPLAADKVYMPNNAMMMIHNPSGWVFGDSVEMRKMSDTLDKVKDSIIAVYMEKTGMDEKKLKKLMDAETWMTAKDAVELGFADELQKDKNIAASIGKDFMVFNDINFEINRYKNIPKFGIFNIKDDKEKFLKDETDKIDKKASEIILNQSKYFTDLKLKLMGGM